MRKVSIGVRDLAMFVHRRGDIHHRFDEYTTTLEGRLTQSKYQKRRMAADSAYQTEVQLASNYEFDPFELRVSGRADGVSSTSESLIVEEIKTTRINPSEVHTHVASVNYAQLKLCAAMLVSEQPYVRCCGRLIYVHPDTFSIEMFEEPFETDSLARYFDDTCQKYLSWLREVDQRLQSRNREAKTQEFPFANFNFDQRRTAVGVFKSLRDKEDLLLEAPTGTGKTIATIFPAVKAIGESKLDRVAFLTARTTGQRAAREALVRLQKDNDSLVFVNISAKDRVCLTPGAPCEPAACEYAKGYYDKLWDARSVLLKQKSIDEAAVKRVARTLKVCPFALSLDVAEWADFIVCDYNYVFDPMVAYSRMHSKLFSRVGMLIDEAHRLGDRVRSMLSCELHSDDLKEGLAQVSGSTISKPLRVILATLEQFGSEQCPGIGELEVASCPDELWTALEEFNDQMVRVSHEDFEQNAFRECVFMCSSFLAAKERFNESEYMWLLSRTEQRLALELKCLVPGGWIRRIADQYAGSIRFSGTLSPTEVFQEEHGLDGPVFRASSALDPSRFGIFVVPDISTYFADRERTLSKLAQTVSSICGASNGNWLIALPSFVYLQIFQKQLKPHHNLMVQKQSMSLREREAFIKWINEDSQRIGVIVMGGVFAESIDYEEHALDGVIVVGPGLPPRSVEREKTMELSELKFEIAYRQPAMTRVIQAAGRVVRSENDRGVVVLIDPRFTHASYKQYFPTHWRPQVLKADFVSEAVADFYRSSADALPRSIAKNGIQTR